MEILKIYQGDFWASGFRENEILDDTKWGIFPDNPEPLNPSKYLTEITIDKVDYSQDIFFQLDNGYVYWYSEISRYDICLKNIQLNNQEGSFLKVENPIQNIFDLINILNQARKYTIEYKGHFHPKSSGYNVVFIFNQQGVSYEDHLIYFPEFKYLYGTLTIELFSSDSIANFFIQKDKIHFKF